MKKVFALCLTLVMALCLFSGCQQASQRDYSAQEILEAIKAAYGDNYLPDGAMDEEYIKNVIGLDMGDVEDYAGELSMISFHPDRVLVLKAKEGKGETVETALNAALETIRFDAGFYPMNAPKANAAKVLRHGDYVCLLLLGAVDESSQTEEEMAAFAEEQVQIGVDAVNALFE